MDEAVDRREGHGLIREDFAPFTEWLIGGDDLIVVRIGR